VSSDPFGTSPVRAEDAIDVAAVDRWVRGLVDGLGAGEPEVRQFRGGASNLTYLLRYPGRDLVLRRPPAGTKAASAHDMRREYDVQRLLRPHFAAVPQMLAYATDEDSPVGSECYVMAHVPGVILRRDMPEELRVDAVAAATLAERFVDTLALLHTVDIDAAGLGALDRGVGYARRQVAGWSRRYRQARTDDVPDGAAVMAWLAQHVPDDVAHALVHGDWRFDNLVLDPDTLDVRAVLDWEMATIGDPLMDLGAALAYWVQTDDDPAFQQVRRQPTHLPGMPTRDQVVERYLQHSGLTLPVEWTFYEVYGLFRLAVIAQQIWYRVRAGQTTNPDFAVFGRVVGTLMVRCAELAT
jgi:aminoglycoside phosphotransferase (APT) family kinase protein